MSTRYKMELARLQCCNSVSLKETAHADMCFALIIHANERSQQALSVANALCSWCKRMLSNCSYLQLSPAPAPKPKPTPKPKPSPPPPKRRPPPPPPRKRPPPPAAKARNAKKAPTKKATPKTAANQRLSRLAQALKAKIAAKKPARG